jgi:hypothetical protein
MQAVSLADGMGRRLGAMTENQIKCVVSLHGTTLIERSPDRLMIVVGAHRKPRSPPVTSPRSPAAEASHLPARQRHETLLR